MAQASRHGWRRISPMRRLILCIAVMGLAHCIYVHFLLLAAGSFSGTGPLFALSFWVQTAFLAILWAVSLRQLARTHDLVPKRKRRRSTPKGRRLPEPGGNPTT